LARASADNLHQLPGPTVLRSWPRPPRLPPLTSFWTPGLTTQHLRPWLWAAGSYEVPRAAEPHEETRMHNTDRERGARDTRASSVAHATPRRHRHHRRRHHRRHHRRRRHRRPHPRLAALSLPDGTRARAPPALAPFWPAEPEPPLRSAMQMPISPPRDPLRPFMSSASPRGLDPRRTAALLKGSCWKGLCFTPPDVTLGRGTTSNYPREHRSLGPNSAASSSPRPTNHPPTRRTRGETYPRSSPGSGLGAPSLRPRTLALYPSFRLTDGASQGRECEIGGGGIRQI
jgi:hypothetical protein